MKCLEMLTVLPEVKGLHIFFHILMPTPVSKMPSSHKAVLIHVLSKFSVCSNVNEVANQT